MWVDARVIGHAQVAATTTTPLAVFAVSAMGQDLLTFQSDVLVIGTAHLAATTTTHPERIAASATLKRPRLPSRVLKPPTTFQPRDVEVASTQEIGTAPLAMISTSLPAPNAVCATHQKPNRSHFKQHISLLCDSCFVFRNETMFMYFYVYLWSRFLIRWVVSRCAEVPLLRTPPVSRKQLANL